MMELELTVCRVPPGSVLVRPGTSSASPGINRTGRAWLFRTGLLGESPLRCASLRSVPLSEVVCDEYGVERSELSRRGSRHPARAAMAYLARRHTSATNGDLTEILGVSRAESVPNLTRRFERWLSTDRRVRKELERLEHKLSQEQGE